MLETFEDAMQNPSVQCFLIKVMNFGTELYPVDFLPTAKKVWRAKLYNNQKRFELYGSNRQAEPRTLKLLFHSRTVFSEVASA